MSATEYDYKNGNHLGNINDMCTNLSRRCLNIPLHAENVDWLVAQDEQSGTRQRVLPKQFSVSW